MKKNYRLQTLLILLGLSFPLVAFSEIPDAQNSAIPQETINEMSLDLAALQKSISSYKPEPAPGKIKVINTSDIRAGASATAATLATVNVGQTFDVLGISDGWYSVKLDDQIGKAAGWLKAIDTAPLTQTLDDASQGYALILQQLNSLKEKYKDNPYVFIRGFSINVGVPPSVSLDFEFKKK